MHIVHDEELAKAWVLDTRELSGRWHRASEQTACSLPELVKSHVDDYADPDFIVTVRLRHIETGEIVDPAEAFEAVLAAAEQVSEKVVGIETVTAARLRRPSGRLGVAGREARLGPVLTVTYSPPRPRNATLPDLVAEPLMETPRASSVHRQ